MEKQQNAEIVERMGAYGREVKLGAVSVLGAEYEIWRMTEDPYPERTEISGWCDWTANGKKVVAKEIGIVGEAPQMLENPKKMLQKVLRQLIVEAFFKESGIRETYGDRVAFELNAAIASWFAQHGQKIHAAWEEAGALD